MEGEAAVAVPERKEEEEEETLESIEAREMQVPVLGPDGLPISKKGRKKALRRLRTREYLQVKKQEKKEEKKKMKEERRAAAAAAAPPPPPPSAAAEPEEKPLLTKRGRIHENVPTSQLKRSRKEHQDVLRMQGQRIAIDMDFDDKMNDSGISSMAQQIAASYAVNKKSRKPVNLYLTSIDGRIKQQLQKTTGFAQWRVNVEAKHYTEVFPKEDIVYLSADSPNTLETLDPKKAYIIGGLVDRNFYKGLTEALAKERGIPTARLPIGDYIVKSSKVLAVNHVVAIITHYHEHGDWEKAFDFAIPGRKKAEDDKNGAARVEQEKEETDENKVAAEENRAEEEKVVEDGRVEQ